MRKIVLTGGGTAGHVVGNFALVPFLAKEFDIYYIGSDGIEKNLVENFCKQSNVKIKYIEYSPIKLRRSLTPRNLLIPFKYFKSHSQVKKVLERIKPDIVFSKGGYVALPVVKAAQKLGIPTLTHESDLSIGLANKLMYAKCKHLLCAFSETAKKYKNGLHTGNPLRQQIFQGNKEVICKKYEFSNKPNLLIVCGSSGSKGINTFIINSIEKLLYYYNIIHITGKGNLSKIAHKNYVQLEYAYDIENYFAWADFVISRAGSNAASELLVLQKLVLFIPLPKEASRGDQIENALLFEKNGVAAQLQQTDLSVENVLKKLTYLQENKAKIQLNIKQQDYKNASSQIVDIVMKTAKP